VWEGSVSELEGAGNNGELGLGWSCGSKDGGTKYQVHCVDAALRRQRRRKQDDTRTYIHMYAHIRDNIIYITHHRSHHHTWKHHSHQPITLPNTHTHTHTHTHIQTHTHTNVCMGIDSFDIIFYAYVDTHTSMSLCFPGEGEKENGERRWRGEKEKRERRWR
jgi:hypothetical protein